MMNLIPDDQQQQISDLASDFLRRELPLSRLHHGASRPSAIEVRRAFAELGWFAIALPEERGGAGFGVVEEVLIFRQIGHVIGPVAPIAIVLAAKLADSAGLCGLRDRLVSGDAGAALAIAEAPLCLAGKNVSGIARVYGVEEAACALVEVGDETLLLDTAGETLSHIAWLDQGTAVARVDLFGLPILARASAIPTRINGALLTSAMLVGLSEGAAAMITEYAKIRETFGRKIGAYQAVRHPIAEAAARCEHAKALLYFAALAVAGKREDADLQVRSAKVVAHRAATQNADINIQLHGGIGITDDLAAHHFMKRALMLAPWFGSRKANLDALLDAPLLTI